MIITATFDTVQKTLSVAEDGNEVADVAYVEMFRGYSDEKKFGCRVATSAMDEEHKLNRMTHLSASDKGLVAHDEAQVAESIAAYMSRE